MFSIFRYLLLCFLLIALVLPETSSAAKPGKRKAEDTTRSSSTTQQTEAQRKAMEAWIRENYGIKDPKEPTPKIRDITRDPYSGDITGLYGPMPPTRSTYNTRWVQESLNTTIGSKLTVDGRRGPRTRDAIRQFQRKFGLKVDGTAGPETLRVLEREAGPPKSYVPVIMPPTQNGAQSHYPVQRYREVYAPKNVYINVVREGNDVRVMAEFTPGESRAVTTIGGSNELSGRRITSPTELKDLVDSGRTVIHRGNDLPPQWRDNLPNNRYVRASNRSPKRSNREHGRAAELLDTYAVPGKTRVFNALPKAREARQLENELRDMDLLAEEASSWRKLNEDIDAVGINREIPIETATKEKIIEELRTGENNTTVLVGHFDVAKGTLYLPGGQKITAKEIADIRREIPPERIIVLLACSTGQVNMGLPSFGERILQNNLAINVIAPPKPVSAKPVPELLDRYLNKNETIREVFLNEDYQPMTQRIEKDRLVRVYGSIG